MAELWDIYDINRNKTGKLAVRGESVFEEGEYHIVVGAIILNSENEILLTQRAPFKTFPLMWECNGGSILTGETSLQGVLREVKEEIGLTFEEKDAVFLKSIKRDCVPPDFKDFWVFRKNVNDGEITLPDGEAVDFKWVSIGEYEKMCQNNEIVAAEEFQRKDFEKAIELI